MDQSNRAVSGNLPLDRVVANGLERISDSSPVRAIPSWQQNKDLLEWLCSLQHFGGHACMPGLNRDPPTATRCYVEPANQMALQSPG